MNSRLSFRCTFEIVLIYERYERDGQRKWNSHLFHKNLTFSAEGLRKRKRITTVELSKHEISGFPTQFQMILTEKDSLNVYLHHKKLTLDRKGSSSGGRVEMGIPYRTKFRRTKFSADKNFRHQVEFSAVLSRIFFIIFLFSHTIHNKNMF